MPLALDLISTLVRGWILPVATTERATSPFSIVGEPRGVDLLAPRRAAIRPNTATKHDRRRSPTIRRLRLLPAAVPVAVPVRHPWHPNSR